MHDESIVDAVRSRLAPLCWAYVEFMRNTPLLVQLYFLFYVLPLAGITLGALETGIFGLGLYYGGDYYHGHGHDHD